MRELSRQLLECLQPPAGDDDVIPAIGRAISDVRGRPVRLRKVAFPPGTASGLWVDRADHDVIAYEEHTDPEHQIVIVGHEAFHMFQGHCGNHTGHGHAAARALEEEAAATLRALAALVCDSDDAEVAPTERMDAALHIAARADTKDVRQDELDAERFGVRFATEVQAALTGARSPADPQVLAGRIQVAMAHRVRRT